MVNELVTLKLSFSLCVLFKLYSAGYGTQVNAFMFAFLFRILDSSDLFVMLGDDNL